MTRLNVLLLIAVMATAMFLVHTQYRSRLLYTELDRANTEARRLEVDGDRLQVEKRAQATPLRVEKLAKEQLQMRTSTPAITQYVTVQAAAAAAPVVPEAAASSSRARQVLDNSRRIE